MFGTQSSVITFCAPVMMLHKEKRSAKRYNQLLTFVMTIFVVAYARQNVKQVRKSCLLLRSLGIKRMDILQHNGLKF
jgi:hypothetical protein